MQLQSNYPLTQHNTFGIAAHALLFGRFNSTAQLATLLNMPEVAGMPRLFLGGGSNILFTQDFPGVVLLNEIPGITVVKEDDENVVVKAGAGVGWHQFVLHCVENGWGGIENLSLIPGKVGAAPMQNIGAYGVELQDRFESLDAVDLQTGQAFTLNAAQCAF
ncbi:MAG TPA: FAD-binding protein, partial [Flavobacteriales bacterium]|nr:FAD-binding protein [Flavobacteriales bacterium]